MQPFNFRFLFARVVFIITFSRAFHRRRLVV